MTAKKPVAKAKTASSASGVKPGKAPAAPAKARPAAKPVGKTSAKAVVPAKKPAGAAAAKGVPAKSAMPGAKAPAPKLPAKPATPVSAKPVKAPSPTVSTQPADKTPATASPSVKTVVSKSSSVAASTAKKASAGGPVAAPAPAPLSAAAVRLASLPPVAVARPMPTPILVKKDPKLVNNWKTKRPDELTDAEVLAMPDSEYMNDKQVAFFRHKLVQLKDAMLHNADETTEHLREDTIVVPDPADRATIEEEHALELRTRDRERKLLKKIEQSIARIDAGDYGYCDETGEPIGVGRLLARPTATLSLEAQQRRELKQKMFGD